MYTLNFIFPYGFCDLPAWNKHTCHKHTSVKTKRALNKISKFVKINVHENIIIISHYMAHYEYRGNWAMLMFHIKGMYVFVSLTDATISVCIAFW